MSDTLLSMPSPPALPRPMRERWQPLRIGLVDMFHYDSEEFWFHDGHLLLRGNNGTGKSKVLSLTLPLLFDANLRPSRVEPDGDSGKKMAWNLLLGSYPRRIGYSWIEFGRIENGGQARYLTLGVGLYAVAGRTQVDSWYFLIEGDSTREDPRIGQDLWLTTGQHQVLTRERLREALTGRGQLFENNTQGYRRAVDERLFHLGQRRYDALMDTLIQLRQPQLSKKPDETELSNALSEALPPLPLELLGDVAEALNQLEEDRRQLEETRRLEQAITQFEQRYRRYTGMLARRQARELRQAQTGFDNASEVRNRAQGELERTGKEQVETTRLFEEARQNYLKAREEVDTLQSDPTNQEANRLTQAEGDARRWHQSAENARRQRDEARAQLQREAESGRQRARQAEQTRKALEQARVDTVKAAGVVGIDADIIGNPLLALAAEALAATVPDQQRSTVPLREVVLRRRQDIALLRQHHTEVDKRRNAEALAQEAVQEQRLELDEALAQREQADLNAEQAAETLLDAWSNHAATLEQLRFNDDDALQRLVDWAARPEGDNPATLALATAWQKAQQKYASRQAKLESERDEQRQRRTELEAERERLLAGEDELPPEPLNRAPGVRAQRSGAPLWQLVDFQPHLQALERAGIEAALEACGLLDAWLSPDGSITDASGKVLLDTSWTIRVPAHGPSLNDALIPALPESCDISPALLAELLAGVAYGQEESREAEAWLSPDGRFRLGVLAGVWGKPEARYIGHTARERARQSRLEEIVVAIAELDTADADLLERITALGADIRRAEQEKTQAPSDRALLDAIAAATAAGREVNRAQQRLVQGEARMREMEALLKAAQEQLRQDASDLRLPPEPERLPRVEEALETFDAMQSALIRAAHDWQRDWPAHVDQQRREDEARATLERDDETLSHAAEQAEQAKTRFETLRQAVGQQVDELRHKLAAAIAQRELVEQTSDVRRKAMNAAERAHAVAGSEAEQAERTLAERVTERQQAISRLQRFADSGLLLAALPELLLPEAWTIDPALQLARRIEQLLSQLADDDTAWSRMHRQIGEDLTELQRALSALGHQAVSEPNDWGFAVHIQYQNRAESPGTLAALLVDDIAQRSELLSAREREVLENHLQAEIASEIQRLMRAADERVRAINTELHKRPTTTGVRFRLVWEPLSEEEGAPAGLMLARERLLNTSADLWSLEERRTVGTMLQGQIGAERARTDAEVTGGSLIDQLARALDYRHWHCFRVQRQQDGQWRKLSGPASSGERALGLTVPLFAAISSFYGHGAAPLAPRLMLLDEAFAGIDDSARAHCMGLIREFDLDFVITSEREWGCYAELPGVAICQLQRREGIDAVFVSRWIWDGREKRIEEDPDRRFPSA